jgi:hypothetical protein
VGSRGQAAKKAAPFATRISHADLRGLARFAFGWIRFGSVPATSRDLGPVDRLGFLGSWLFRSEGHRS